jgi:hypothetical protein
MVKRIFVCADHGLAIIYFLQSDVISTLIAEGNEILLLTDDHLVEKVNQRFGMPGLIVEGMRMKQAATYEKQVRPSVQWWLHFLRRAGASNRINLEAVNGFVSQVKADAHGKRQMIFPAMHIFIGLMRRSKLLRSFVVRAQDRFNPAIYSDLFEKYRPGLVIAATPGWRLDRYLLREAAALGIPTASVIVGWDNTSSYSLPGAAVEWANCWSEIQKEEMVKGADWDPAKINIGGIPSYDGYINKRWLVLKEEYFKQHNLDPNRRLISYASSFITFSPNLQNVEALAVLVSSDQLAFPSQLLIRLHPTHFLNVPEYVDEREKILSIARRLDHVHVVEPVSLGGEMGYYSGEDMPEKSSMMAYSDVMVTVYSTMVVEASMHGTPVVSLCIDSEDGWPGKFTLPLTKIGGWPTHRRFRESMAGREAVDKEGLRQALDYYLENPKADNEARIAFLKRECTFLEGNAGKHTAKFLGSLVHEE